MWCWQTDMVCLFKFWTSFYSTLNNFHFDSFWDKYIFVYRLTNCGDWCSISNSLTSQTHSTLACIFYWYKDHHYRLKCVFMHGELVQHSLSSALNKCEWCGLSIKSSMWFIVIVSRFCWRWNNLHHCVIQRT